MLHDVISLTRRAVLLNYPPAIMTSAGEDNDNWLLKRTDFALPPGMGTGKAAALLARNILCLAVDGVFTEDVSFMFAGNSDSDCYVLMVDLSEQVTRHRIYDAASQHPFTTQYSGANLVGSCRLAGIGAHYRIVPSLHARHTMLYFFIPRVPPFMEDIAAATSPAVARDLTGNDIRIAMELLNGIQAGQTPDIYMAAGVFSLAAFFFNKLKAPHTPGEGALKIKDIQSLLAIKERIEANVVKEYRSLEQMAAYTGMSGSRFAKLFKLLTGYSYAEFCRYIRIEKARELLSAGKDSINGVAHTLGYRNAGYFSKCFKTYYGVMPRDFLK